ncbi:MAG TPA: transketolase, partial [Gammaproteobacteria bacterium]|nr:transketolase [Gammaproteobacteria bacterium]
MRKALRSVRSIFVFTHDSIGLGEDGPTHQPVEHLSSLRVMPNMTVWRPCDAVESFVAWKSAIEHQQGPSSLIFSRQTLAHQPRTAEQLANIHRGGYILKDSAESPELILIATGSEVALAMDAAVQLADKGIHTRVVSMPCCELFEQQDDAYRESVLPAKVTARVSIEAGESTYWYRYVGLQGSAIGMNSFGASAPGPVLFEKFGFSADQIVSQASRLLASQA